MRRRTLPLVCLLLFPCLLGGATVQILNNDAPGEGLNDGTAVAPIGGNGGVTLGQQRLNVLLKAAQIWGQALTSQVPVQVRAQFGALTCTSNAATLASAGAVSLFRDATGKVLSPANHWFNEAITNKLTGTNNSANPDIDMTINVSVGSSGGIEPEADCGFTFYLGLDGNAPAGQVALLPVLLHELAHGLGFQTFTDSSTGAYLSGYPSKYDSMLFDTMRGLHWDQMTQSERALSAMNGRRLVWTGNHTTAAIPGVLAAGTPELTVLAPASLSGTYFASAYQGASGVYPNLTVGGVSGEVVAASDACAALTAATASGVAGRIALVDRGYCGFNTKLANVTAAGAIGMIVVNNTDSSLPPVVGPDVTPAIPALIISQADGEMLKNVLRSSTRTGVLARVGLNNNYSGADSLGRALMYAPSPYVAGSSVSHFDPVMFRNQLMEPSAAPGVTTDVLPPADLTLRFLQDMGW